MQDLNSPTECRTHTRAVGVWKRNHWTAREVTESFLSLFVCLFLIEG